MDKNKLKAGLDKALEAKGKRKFAQTVEMIFNFQGIDFAKPENRLNLDLILPKGKGKEPKVCVFADTQMALSAKNAKADLVVDAAGITKMAADKKALKKMCKQYEFIAQPSMMIPVGKSLGQVLGARGKLPKPVMGMSVEEAIKQVKTRVRIVSKGKYLPFGQCIIGTEAMSVDDLLENAIYVFGKVAAKTTEPSIRNMYFKLSMGPAIKVAA